MGGYTPRRNQWFSLEDGIMGLEIIIFLLTGVLQLLITYTYLFLMNMYCFCELRLEAEPGAASEYLGAIIGNSRARRCAHQGDNATVDGFVW